MADTRINLRFNTPIQIQAIAEVKDTQGAAANQWVVVHQVLGDIRHRGGSVYHIYIRWLPGIENDMRVRSNEGYIYQIVSAPQFRERQNILRLECAELQRCELEGN